MDQKKTLNASCEGNATSVPGGEHAKMAVVRQAEELEIYTARAIFNYKIFPKKCRPVFTSSILSLVFEINDSITSANELDLRIPNEHSARSECQRTALRACKKLINRVNTAFHLKIIDEGKFEYWIKMIINVKRLTGAWLKSDEKRGFSGSESMKGKGL
jgi:hypothetical protein